MATNSPKKNISNNFTALITKAKGLRMTAINAKKKAAAAAEEAQAASDHADEAEKAAKNARSA